MTEPTPDWVELTVLAEDQPAMAVALLEAAGPERVLDVQSITGGFYVPADIAAAVAAEPADAIGDVKAPAKGKKAAAASTPAAAATPAPAAPAPAAPTADASAPASA